MRVFRFVLPVFALVFIIAPTATQATEPGEADLAVAKLPYANLVSNAQKFSLEGSWARAEEYFAQAQKVAPDSDARHWCALWLEDAAWRSEKPSDWQSWLKKHTEAFDALLKPYTDGDAHDEFWMATLESRADFLKSRNDGLHWADRLAIADYLAAQAPTPEAAKRYVSHLQQLTGLAEAGPTYGLNDARLLTHLGNGARIGATAEDRAWCLLSSAVSMSGKSYLALTERDERWQQALTSARGTRWEPLARTEELAWRIRRSSGQNPPAGTPEDVPAALAALAALQAELKLLPGDEAIRAAKILAALAQTLTERRLTVFAPEQVPQGTPVQFSFGAANLESLHATLALAEQIGDDKRAPNGETPVREWEIPLADTRPGAWNTAGVEATPGLKAGIYELRLEGRTGTTTVAQRAEIVVSDYEGMAFTAENGGTDVFVQTLATGEPVSDAKVSGFIFIGSDELPPSPLATQTDREGRFRAPALAVEVKEGRNEIVAALVNDQPVVFKRWIRGPGRFSDRIIFDALFDRPLYRPGEMVHWKLIARERNNGHFVLPAELPGMVVAAELNGEPILEPVPVKFDAFGSAHGEIVIPASARPGDVNLILGTINGDKDQRLGELYEAFRVDNFVAPAVEAKVELASGPDSLRPGREMTVRVKASYLSGGAVVDAKVECKFACDRSSTEGRSALGEQAIEWADTLAREPRHGRTDATGAVEFRVQLPAILPEYFWLEANVGLVPEGAPETTTRSTWAISPSGVFLDTQEWREPHLSSPGTDFVFAGRILDGANTPAAFEGEARLVEKRWTEAWLDPTGAIVTGTDLARVPHRQGSSDEKPGSVWHQLHGGYAETIVGTQPVHTDALGRFTASFKVPQAGIFQIQIFRNGAIVSGGDRDLTVGPTVFAIDAGTRSLALPPDQGFVLGPPSVKPGQPFDVTTIFPEGIGAGWLNVSGEESLIARRVVSQGRIAQITIDQPPVLADSAAVVLFWPSEERSGSNSVRCRVACKDESRSLGVSLDPAVVAVRPGADSSVTFKVVDFKGTPVESELGFTAFDEAVAKLAGLPGQIAPTAFEHLWKTTQVRSERFGSRPNTKLEPVKDSRLEQIPLAITNGAMGENEGGTDESTLVLSPFVVESSEDKGYTAKDTLAGTRMRTELKDVRRTTAVAGADPNLPIEIRRHFDSTAFWAPDVVTNGKGEATVSFKYPDNLTQWRLEAYAVGADGNSFGRAATFTRTSLPFQARLQLPRFLVAGDTAECSALLLNRTDADLTASAELKTSGAVVATAPAQLAQSGIAVPKQGEAHTAWTVQAKAAGAAEFTLTGSAGTEGDAMVLPLPVLEDGIQQHTAASGRLGQEARKLELKLPLPSPLDPRRTRVTVQLSPSHAAVVLDALPYLVDYPYGCVEQTMSRFLPAVIAQKTLTELGLSAAAVEQGILAGESRADAQRRAGTAGLRKIDDVVQKSLGRLAEAQRNDGGFGWWPGAGSTDLWMTAYVAWGLSIARTAGVNVPDELEKKTWEALVSGLPEDGVVSDEQAWAVAAVAASKLADENSIKKIQAAFAWIYAAREKLSATGRACLAQTAVKLGTAEQRAVILRNLENGAERVRADNFGDTVHWGKTGNYWSATDGAVETTSLTLLALLELDPKHPLIEPAMNWLVLNRRSAHWQSTRDSAFAVLALTRYIAQRRELGGDVETEVLANGKSFGRVKLNRDSVLKGTTTLDVPAAMLRSGANTLTLKRVSGTGPLYAVALASAWATGDTVKPAGHMVNVARGFVRQKAEPTLIGTLRITPQPLPSGGSATAGEQVTAKVTITVPNDLEYVMIEVPKPAGCEPLNPLSGWDAKIRRVQEKVDSAQEDEGEAIYREERDDRSVFFISSLESGTWEIRFGMRATTPGDFRALPVQATAMYVPEIRANSDAQRVKIGRTP